MSFGWASSIAVITLATIGYLIYFDQRRQRDPEFRLRLKQKREQSSKTDRNRAANDITSTLDELENEVAPTSPQEREQYFMKQLSLAEELMAKGPAFFEAAAKCLLRVLKVYPDPMQLLMILEQSTPQPVFSLLMDLMATDMKTQESSESKIEDIDE